MSFQEFEDLLAWQKARILAREVYRLTTRPPFGQDFGLRQQIQRAAVSVMSNIAEGYERFNPREFAQYLLIAKGSSGEVRSQLYIALDLGYLSQDEFDELNRLCMEIKRLLLSLRTSVLKTPQPPQGNGRER